ERDVLLVRRRQDDLRDRHERLRELRVLDVLQHHALGALLLRDALVVRQVEGGGLDAAVRVAGGEHLVDDNDGREAAELRVAVLRIDRQVALDVLQLGRKLLELFRLVLVLYRDERFVGRFVVEQLVFVDLVRANRRLDGAFQFHPRDVAVVVVVREKRGRPLRQEVLQRRLRRERGR